MLRAEQEARLAMAARKIFATRLGIARVALYSDQDSAGAVLGLKKHRWGCYERGDREPPLWVLRRLPQMFHRPLSWFFDLPDERELSDREARIILALRAIPDDDIRFSAETTLLTVLERAFLLGQPEGEGVR